MLAKGVWGRGVGMDGLEAMGALGVVHWGGSDGP